MHRTLVASLLTLSVVAGCGDDEDPRVQPVRDYIESANRVQARATPRFTEANEAFKKFAEGDLKGRKAGRDLRTAELQIASARQEVAALRPPAEARRLHDLLLRTYDLNVLLAAETRQMAGFVPRATEALARLRGVQRRLRRGLRVSGGASKQVRALRAYAADLQGVRDRLNELEAPATMVADRDTQVRVLGEARQTALRLARAIEREDAPAVERLLGEFGASDDPQPELAGLTKSQIAAYRQRIVTLNRAGAAVRAERARLARELL